MEQDITEAVQQHIGKRLVRKGESAGASDNSVVSQEELQRVPGVRSVRVISPGMMVTMDYRPDRLNVNVDGNGIIRGFRMG